MMKVLRVDGGLIGMAKCEMIHGTKVVIEHNTGAHHRFIGASNSKEILCLLHRSLTLQKTIVMMATPIYS